MPTQKFSVKGVDHKGEHRLEERLRAMDGVLFAAVNHEAQCAEVEFEDDCVTPAEIAAVMGELGYDSKPIG